MKILSPSLFSASAIRATTDVMAKPLVLMALLIGGVMHDEMNAWAATTEANSPLTYEADSGQADLAKKIYSLKGRVVVSQGNLTLRSSEAQVRQVGKGQATVTVSGSTQAPASFEQRSADDKGEVLQGQSQKIDYDTRTSVVVLSGQAVVKRTKDGRVLDEITGNSISYNRATQEFNVKSSNSTATSGGRVRGVISGDSGL